MITVNLGNRRERVSTISVDQDGCDVVMVYAHGAGAGMQHPFMEASAQALVGVGVASLRFQFPYMENGRRAPDRQPTLLACIEAAVEQGQSLANGRPLLAGGKSMGGRMASLACAAGRIEPIAGLVFFGFPLHPSGKPSRTRASHLNAISKPMLFLQGTRDRLANPADIEAVCTTLSDNATLEFVDGADHSFNFLKSAGRQPESVFAALADSVRCWVDRSGIAARKR